MQEAFGVVIFVVVALSAVGAVAALVHTGRTYDDIGGGGLFEDRPAQAAETAPGLRDDEIRQMLAARNARRRARGEDALDVERQLSALTRPPSGDPALEAEIRALVESRNRGRVARGEVPLDVDAEVERRLREA